MNLLLSFLGHAFNKDNVKLEQHSCRDRWNVFYVPGTAPGSRVIHTSGAGSLSSWS